MKISKKIVSIGSITAITAPIVVAVSCGGQNANVQIKKPIIKFYGKGDGGTPDKNGKTNYGTFRIHIPELGISYQGYNSVPFEADNISASPVYSYVNGGFDGNNRRVIEKYPTIIWNNNKNLNSTKGIGHDVEITITLKPGPGISSINGKKEVQYTYTVNKDKILYDMRAIEDFGILKEEDKNAWISKARHAIKDRLNFKDPKSLKKGEHLYTFGSVTKIPDGFLDDDQGNNSNFKFLPGDIDFSSVTEIGKNAFLFLKSLPENINFSSVTKIGSNAFSDLKSLPENIDFSSVTEIGEGAFVEITKLPENIDLSNVIEMGRTAFMYVDYIPKNIRFNNKITYEEFSEAFSIGGIIPKMKKYNESWFNAHRNPAKTTTP